MTRALVFAFAMAVGVSAGAACQGAKPSSDFHGVKLGMTAGDVRQRFQGPKGTWKATPGEEMLLDYSPDQGTVPTVRFEFHSGMLVAIRATLDPHDPSASLLPREVTAGAVIAREHDGPHVKLTWLSRDCPTHKDEADRLVKGAP